MVAQGFRLRPEAGHFIRWFPLEVRYFDGNVFEEFVLFFYYNFCFTYFSNRICVNSSLAWETNSWVPQTLVSGRSIFKICP